MKIEEECKRKIERKGRGRKVRVMDSEEEVEAAEETKELDFGGDIDQEGLIKEGDPSLNGYISIKAKRD